VLGALPPASAGSACAEAGIVQTPNNKDVRRSQGAIWSEIDFINSQPNRKFEERGPRIATVSRPGTPDNNFLCLLRNPNRTLCADDGETPRDDVIDLEWSRVERRRQAAIFATSLCPLPNFTDEICVQDAQLLGRALKGAAPFRLHHGQKVADMQVAVKLSLSFAGELALTS
jgi:hypothetical protein